MYTGSFTYILARFKVRLITLYIIPLHQMLYPPLYILLHFSLQVCHLSLITPPISLHLHVEFLGKGQLGKEPRKNYIHSELVLTPNLAITNSSQYHVSSSFHLLTNCNIESQTDHCPLLCLSITYYMQHHRLLSLVHCPFVSLLHSSFVCYCESDRRYGKERHHLLLLILMI